MTTRLVYFDIDREGIKNSSNDITINENEQSVLESVANIITTQPKSKIYKKRRYGCDLNQFLFELIDNSTALKMMDQVVYSINEFEPRAKNLIVEITPNEDKKDFEINISFQTDVSERELTLQTTLRKIR